LTTTLYSREQSTLATALHHLDLVRMELVAYHRALTEIIEIDRS